MSNEASHPCNVLTIGSEHKYRTETVVYTAEPHFWTRTKTSSPVQRILILRIKSENIIAGLKANVLGILTVGNFVFLMLVPYRDCISLVMTSVLIPLWC